MILTTVYFRMAIAVAATASRWGLIDAYKEIEQSEEFVESRRKHSAIESSINALENHRLDRCLDHGLDGFERYVALSVLARNIQILGHLL